MYGGWKPYVSVAERHTRAQRFASKLAKQGHLLRPIELSGRTIAKTFWGKAWCENLESYSDFENRLPRGRTYVRNGSVIDLQIAPGEIKAIVSGSEIYHVEIRISKLGSSDWRAITRECSQTIDSLMDLLQGRLSQGVMQRLTRQKDGLFPRPKEIKIGCSCPDWAYLCKHAAAVLYGVGSRLDEEPELLFTLRGVDHLELISQAVSGGNLDQALSGGEGQSLAEEDLGALFGIDLEPGEETGKPKARAAKKKPAGGAKNPRSKPAAKTVAKKPAKMVAKKSAKPASVKSASAKPAATAKRGAKTGTAKKART